MAQQCVGQITIPGLGTWSSFESVCPSPRSDTADVDHAQVHSPGWGLTGICLGSPGCLCGQRELSDSPLWIENE